VIGRSVLVHVPRGITSGRQVPLVVALHGAGGSGPKMERYSGLSHAADVHHFIVAYPNAAGAFWNSTGSRGAANDVVFVGAVIDALQQTLCIDPQHIFAAGISNGGGMAALLGCALSSRLAAIASVAGAYSGQPQCQTARPVSVLEIHGTADLVAPYFGSGATASGGGPPPFVKGWVHRDSCSRTASTQELATRTVLYRWRGCASGASVEHVKILDGTHQWPGALPPDPGPPSQLCGACEIWSFFSKLSLDGPGSASGGVGLHGTLRGR
jgi:polyhydroxybutyrate depolymerase